MTGPIQHPVAAFPIDDPAALRAARRHRVTLLREIHAFEQAVAGPAGDPDWRPRFGARLTGLRGEFTEHVRLTEGRAGLYTELLDRAPRLARTVHVLLREHVAMAAVLAGLQRRAELPETSTEELRGSAGDLLGELSRHRQRGADLVYRAYGTDIGRPN